LGSYAKGFKNPMTQTSTRKYVEEVTTKVLQANKGNWIILSHGNCEYEYGEFEFGGE
jgi:hypothetical protein